MKIAIYPGSFDPVTKGHIDILKTATEIFDKVIIAVAHNSAKVGFVPVEKRVELITESVKDMPNVEVDAFEGLTINYAKEKGATVLIRGLRAVSDFEYEMQMASFNRHLNPDIETVFFTADGEFSLVSSSMIRNIASLHGDIKSFVPAPVYEALLKKC